jgi:hypothetical protein
VHPLNVEVAAFKNWVAQFDPDDQSLAAKLAMRLMVFTANDFEDWLRETRKRLNPKDGPFGAFAIRPLDDGEHIFTGRGDAVLRAGKRLGSEGRFAHVIKRWHDGRRSINIFDQPNLDTMANARIRTVLLFDDLLGSGSRTIKYLCDFISTPTVRSWLSGGLLQIRLVAQVSLPKARAEIADYLSTRPRSQRRAIRLAVDYEAKSLIFDDETEEEKEAIRRLLLKYKLKLSTDERKWMFGHGKSLGTVVFEHGCPNNVPAIFWCSHPPWWQGLFPNRIVPDSFVHPGATPVRPPPGGASSLPLAPDGAEDVLRQMCAGVRSVSKLSEYLRVRMSRVERCVAYLRQIGAIGDDSRPTEKGRSIASQLEEPKASIYVATLSTASVYLPAR